MDVHVSGVTRGISTPLAKELLARMVVRPSDQSAEGFVFSGYY